jgi:hypothetical protein
LSGMDRFLSGMDRFLSGRERFLSSIVAATRPEIN